ncbi:MAG: DUF4465 domain-containing protein [Desulfobulbaceae bacterium]|nr:MAG: DUF4465 domain-containing protein [Desulfobulbaceae bacterium]
MRSYLWLLYLLCFHGLFGQTVADFENIDIAIDTFNNGSDGEGGFHSGDVFLPNEYDDAFGAWRGWAISTKRDTITSGFSNQYSAIDGKGASGTDTYAVGYAFDPITIHIASVSGPQIVDGLHLSNSTYTYLSLLNGDAFSKRFGGASGDEPDYLLITFKYYVDGTLGADSINFYLADFRAEDNSSDYIIDGWTYLDLGSFGTIDSLRCTMSSTDVGAFGINTPTFFCIDRVSTSGTTTRAETQNWRRTPISSSPGRPKRCAISTGSRGTYRLTPTRC